MTLFQAVKILESGDSVIGCGKRFTMYDGEIWVGGGLVISTEQFITLYSDCIFTACEMRPI